MRRALGSVPAKRGARRLILFLSALTLFLNRPAYAQTQTQLFRLQPDPQIWRDAEAAPPVERLLLCAAPPCGAGVTLAIINDPRPFGHGAGPLSLAPGGLAASLLNLRAQALAPGRRLIAVETVKPVTVASRRGYQARYKVEAPDLTQSDLIALALPHDGGVLHLHLAAPVLGEADLAQWHALLKILTLRP